MRSMGFLYYYLFCSSRRRHTRFGCDWSSGVCSSDLGGSSIRFYHEDAGAPRAQEPTTVPLGVAGFAGDFSGVRRFAERDHRNLVQWNMHPEPGGHYAAHLEPDVLADDIRAFYAARR